MAKVVDLKKTVYELAQENPEVVEVMAELGFTPMKDPEILSTVGKKVTIPEGAAMRGVELETIKAAFEAKDFEVQE